MTDSFQLQTQRGHSYRLSRDEELSSKDRWCNLRLQWNNSALLDAQFEIWESEEEAFEKKKKPAWFELDQGE